MIPFELKLAHNVERKNIAKNFECTTNSRNKNERVHLQSKQFGSVGTSFNSFRKLYVIVIKIQTN